MAHALPSETRGGRGVAAAAAAWGVRFSGARQFSLWLAFKKGALAVLAAVGHEATPGTDRELGGAALGSEAVAAQFGIRGGAFLGRKAGVHETKV